MHLAYSHTVCDFGKSALYDDEGDPFQLFSDYDLKLIGSLKTFLPKLEFGGGDDLFFAWMFVKTPDGREFPAEISFYNLSLKFSGWSNFPKEEYLDHFPKELQGLINFSPHDFSEVELDLLIKSLEKGLSSIPPLDYEAIYKTETGDLFIGLKNGVPFSNDRIDVKSGSFDFFNTI